MTDNEIIKALECCGKGDFRNCQECKYLYVEVEDTENCNDVLSRDALDLINRQNAEIKRLRKIVHKRAEMEFGKIVEVVDRARADIRDEAIKEFAERLKKKSQKRVSDHYGERIFIQDIENLVKEMTEGQK